MVVATILAARWIVHRLAVPSVPSSRLGMCFVVALGLMLLAKFTLVLWLGAGRFGSILPAETRWRERSTM